MFTCYKIRKKIKADNDVLRMGKHLVRKRSFKF